MMKNFSNEDMKTMVHEITNAELKGSNEKVYPVTYCEYFNELDESVKLKISDNIIHKVDGYNHRGNIVIFLDKISDIKGMLAWKIFRLAENTYHEVRHSVQKKFDLYSYDGFLSAIDDAINVMNPNTYYSNYSSFSYEIGANLYGVEKAKEYMKKHFPEYYQKIIKKIEEKKEKYKYDYMIYDASFNVDRFINELRKNPDIVKKYSIQKISPVLDIFLNANLSFKNIKQITSNTKFKELDKKIVYAVLSSQLFYENIAIEELSKDELDLLQSALRYTHKIYQNQSIRLEDALNKKIIDKRKYYYDQRTILNKLKPLAEKENLIMLQKEKTKGKTH